jgi:hypothetical protein
MAGYIGSKIAVIQSGVGASVAELNYNDTGAAVGVVVASKTVTADANKDVASFRNITLTGELDAASLDISGDIDVDGTTNLDVVDIDGALTQDGGAVFNEASAAVDFRIESNASTHAFFVDGASNFVRISGDGTGSNLLYNAVGGTTKLAVIGSSSSTAILGNTDTSIAIINTDTTADNTAALHFARADTDDTPNYVGASIVGQFQDTQATGQYPKADMAFLTSSLANAAPSEKVRILANGSVCFNASGVADPTGTNVAGASIDVSGEGNFSVTGAVTAKFNRLQDGDIVQFQSAGASEGTISISGSTTSYNAFSGSHWSRFSDNSQPTILKGTVVETLDEMCDWYYASFNVPATTSVDADGETVEATPAFTGRDSIALPSGASVGDNISHVYSENGVTYTATVLKEADNKHPKCKVSDTADSTRVYGVFAAWDADDDTVNDMYVTAVGTHVVRIHSGQSVAGGELIVSNGDGTAKKQSDDIIRSKTIGKVLSNIKQEIYSDGSYTVPCALYCG